MSQKYKLYSYLREGPGRAEPAKMMFGMADEPYEDVRVHRENEWPALKPTIPGGKLPCLVTPDGSLIQSVSIFMYLAEKLDFLPETTLQKYQSCALLLTLEEIVNFVSNNITKPGVLEKDKNSDDIDEKKKKMKEMVANMKSLSESTKIAGAKFIFGEKISFVDIVFFTKLEQMPEVYPEAKYSDWDKQFMANVRAEPRAAQYLKYRK